MLLVSVYAEVLGMKKIAQQSMPQNFSTAVAALTAFITTIIIALIVTEGTLWDDLVLVMSDYRFYISLCLEFLTVLLYRMNFNRNYDNLVGVKIAIFSSIFIVPIIAILLTDTMGYDTTIVVNYDSNIQLIAIIGLIVGVFAYIVQTRFKRLSVISPMLLIALSLSASFAIFFAVKNMQSFNAYLYFSLIAASNFLLFSLTSLLVKEKDLFKKDHIANYKDIIGSNIVVFSLTPYIATILSAELFTIMKRAFSLKVAVLMDVKERSCIVSEVIKPNEVVSLVILIMVGSYIQHLT